jgi:hypothetical protein
LDSIGIAAYAPEVVNSANVGGSGDPERRRAAGAVALLAAVPTLLFLDVLLGFRAFFARDVMHYYFPAKKILREIVLGGHFPYWNAWFSAGQPLAANPEHEVFYPLTWLILLPDYVYALQLLPLLHIFIATFAMYALLRSMDLGRPAACFGAISFGVGGLMCSLVSLFPCQFSMAWLPLTCLYTRRFLLERRKRDFAIASLFLGVQLLVGEPVTAFLSGLLLGGYAVYRGWSDGRWAAMPKRVGAIALISIAALLLAAVQALPAYDHLGDTSRGRGMSFETARTWSTPPIRFAEVLYPHLLGHVDREGSPAYWGSALYGERRTGFFFGIYCGMAMAVLAIAGVFVRARGWPLFLSVAAFSGIIAAGDHTPLLRILYDTGVADSFRFPEKFLMLGVFAMIVFGSHVLDRLLHGDPAVRKAALRITIAVTVFAFAAFPLSVTSAYARLFRSLFLIDGSTPIEESLEVARGAWLVAGLQGILLLLLIFYAGHARRAVWLTLFAIFVLIDLAPQVSHLAPRISADFYREPPATARAFPADRNGFRIFPLAEWMPATPRARAYARASPAYFWSLRNALSPNLPAAYGLRTAIEGDFDETNLLPEREFTTAVWELASHGPRDWIDIVVAMSNAWYVGVYRKPDEAVAQAGGWNRNLAPVQFIEGRHHPRYYFAAEVVSVRDREEFVRRLKEGTYSRQVAFIHDAAFPVARGVVGSVREWPNGARMDVDTSGRAFLVMSVTPHKYWRITIDGRATPSHITNIGYQGVIVPAGHHVVEMRYRNPLIALGGAVSVVTLLALLLLMRRRPSPL